MAVDTATISPAAVDRGWEKTCRCTAAVAAADRDVAKGSAKVVVVVAGVARAAVGRLAVMSGRPS
ncbi:hypothetical protein ACXJJ3_35580 [Kribbella sp. WER1]